MPPKKQSVNDILSDLQGLSVDVGRLNKPQGELSVDGDRMVAKRDGIQVVNLNLQLVRPDPVQPRRILPDHLHHQFHAGEINEAQALKELIRLAQISARQNGRSFGGVTELLFVLEETPQENDNPPALTPEEQLIKDLTNLAATIKNDGQVNPLTVVDASDGYPHYKIETGERRYWATWLLCEFFPRTGYTHKPEVPCIIVPRDKASPFRQAKENTSRAGLNAIAMMRQVALLLLAVHGYEMPNHAVVMDFYRQALDLDLRSKREYTELVYTSLGGISKPQLSKYKALLTLSDDAVEIADRHNVEEGILRYVIQLEHSEDQVELLRQVIQQKLTVKQVKEIVEKGFHVETNSDELPYKTLPKGAVQLAKWALKPDGEVNSYQIAEATLNMERDKSVAKARLRALREMLEEAEAYIDGI